MPAFNDITGRRFGRLLVRSIYARSQRGVQWLCKCDCGNIAIVFTAVLQAGRTKSCGCGIPRWKHGHRPAGGLPSPTYVSWRSMIQRCTNPKHPGYKNYGGRGIGIDDPRWRKFNSFLADMGHRPHGLTLDRWNNDRGYSKANCRWATPRQQLENRRKKGSTGASAHAP